MKLAEKVTWIFFQVVPTDASKLPDFQKIIKCTSDFETALKEIMFISASDDKDNRLSNFSENVEVHFASKKKIEILAKARNLLLDCDFAIPKVSLPDLVNHSVIYHDVMSIDIECCSRIIQEIALYGRAMKLLCSHRALLTYYSCQKGVWCPKQLNNWWN